MSSSKMSVIVDQCFEITTDAFVLPDQVLIPTLEDCTCIAQLHTIAHNIYNAFI